MSMIYIWSFLHEAWAVILNFVCGCLNKNETKCKFLKECVS